ncbi:hypothetical protein RYX36_034249 [Vicia faba]
MNCWCQEECVMHIVTDLNSVNVGKKFLGCRNYKNQLEKGRNFFKWVGDKVVDGRNFKIERKRKKILKLKNDVLSIRGLLKNSIMLAIISLGLNLIFVTLYLK